MHKIIAQVSVPGITIWSLKVVHVRARKDSRRTLTWDFTRAA